MKTLTQLRESIDALVRQEADIEARITAEKREPSAEERGVISDILDRIDDLHDQYKLQERSERTIKGVSDPEPARSKAAPETHAYGTLPRVEQEQKDRFTTFGGFLHAVRMAGTPGGQVDRRLQTRAASGLSESVPSDGGFLVQKDHSADFLRNVWTNGEITKLIDKTPIGAGKNGLKVNGFDETSRATGSRYGGIQMYWHAEADQKTSSKPKFRQIDLQLKKIIGLWYATDELLEDTVALESECRAAFQNELEFMITEAILNGTGAGQPLGINNAGCLIAVSKETGQAASTIQYQNIVNMWARLKADSRKRAVWVINQDCEPQLHTMSLAVGTGGVPVYLPAGGASTTPYSTLFGRPVIPLEQCKTLGTQGDIMLCDFSQYKAIDKGSAKEDMSIHVRFDYDESCFRIVYRFDGQPKLGSAITPFNGTNTLSHFVALETRS